MYRSAAPTANHVELFAGDTACGFSSTVLYYFVVKSDGARGLSGFGFGTSARDCAEKARRIAIDIGVTPAFAESVGTGTIQKIQGPDDLRRALEAVMGKGASSEAVLIPVLYNRTPLLLLYGDNGMSGKELGDLGGLELFMAQAGMALENKLLQQSVQAEQTSRVENVGPGA